MINFPSEITMTEKIFATNLMNEKIAISPMDILNFNLAEYHIFEAMQICKVQYQNFLANDEKDKQTLAQLKR